MPGAEHRVEITGPYGDRYDEILTPQAINLIAALHAELGPRRQEALAARRSRQAQLQSGGMLDFLESTRDVRDDPAWRVAEPAPGLADRRVEITGPTDRKMTINALNSGANVWLADFEDANTPLWQNMIGGQLNLKDALDRTIDFTQDGKSYALRPDDELATIVVRPRGWHLPEKHILIDGERASGSLTDFALYMVASAQKQIDKGKGPYFYLAKNESHLEARLWNDAFNLAQDRLGIPRGTIRATVLIETIPAAFEMDEILYELRDHSAGLNAGRWDYLFSIIKECRTRDGRHGRVHPVPPRPGGQRGRAGQGAGRQDPRVRRRLRRILGRPPGPGPGLQGGLRRQARLAPEPARPAAPGGDRHRRGPARGVEDPWRHHRGRAAEQHQRRPPVPRHLARRQRRG